MYAEQVIDKQILRELFTKKGGSCYQKQLVRRLVHDQGIPLGRACKLISLAAFSVFIKPEKVGY